MPITTNHPRVRDYRMVSPDYFTPSALAHTIARLANVDNHDIFIVVNDAGWDTIATASSARVGLCSDTPTARRRASS